MKTLSLDRREFLVRTGGTAAVVMGLAGRGYASEAPVVKTTKGQLRGAHEDGYFVFKGVPYAGPSYGANRFKPPTKLEPWTGVRDALAYGLPATQDQEPMPVAGSYERNGPTSENCQVLNVWSPGLGDGKKRPVMFYCHGGGFLHGSGGYGKNEGYDGSALAKSCDVVVVTINHRLGILGYLYLGDVLGEEYAASGNAGMLDIVQALEWVRDNIEAFGGAPGNVMIWGQSGGGFKVSTLLAMPSAHGLFHRACIESGPGVRGIPRATASATANALLADLGMKAGDARQLLKVPASRLIEFQVKYLSAPREGVGTFGPVVDGHTLPANPFDPVATAISAGIPVIIGSNKDEAILGLSHRPMAEMQKTFNLDEAGLRERVRTLLGDKADKTDHVIEVLHRSRPQASPTDLDIAIVTDSFTWINSVRLAERKAMQHGAPVYMYRFSYESEMPAAPGINYPMKTPHGMEIWFKFDHPENSEVTGKRPERFQVAHTMSKTWATFARTGNPNNGAIPTWPAYTAETRATMILDTKCSVVNDPYPEERKLWMELT